MKRILFVCHGNICRSTMAEFVMKHLVKQSGLEDCFFIDSKATSTEELGNPPHHGTVRKLRQVGIPVPEHRASQIRKSDYDSFDYIVGMDHWNMRNIMKIMGEDPDGKMFMLLDFTKRPGEIADPWYKGNFDETYNDVLEGCEGMLEKLKAELNGEK